MARVMRDEMQRLGRPHLLAGQQAFTYGRENMFPMEETFANPIFDIANDHPLPNTHLNGHVYDMGNFMSKELRLTAVEAFCKDAYSFPKPTVLDEDNVASMYRDTTGWTIHRKRAWTALMSGCHYDYIDFSIQVGSEAGTVESRREIRSWMEHLSELMSSFDFINARPATGWIENYPQSLLASGLVVTGHDYVAYLADRRELTDSSAGQPIAGSVFLSLPPGNYDVWLYSPTTGEYSPAMEVKGGSPAVLDLRPFRQDVVVRATRRTD